MCGRFAQFSSRDDYFCDLGLTPEQITFDVEPIARFNVAPGTRVLIISQRDGEYHLDPVYWGYCPEWWYKAPLINARSETAPTGRMFKPLFSHGRAIVPANGWYEWKRDGKAKQPYFIHHRDNKPLFFAAIGRAPFDKEAGREGFVIVTAGSDKGLVDIHDRMPLVLNATAALEWVSSETSADRAAELMHESALPCEDFDWYPVSEKIGNVRNQGMSLIDPE